MNRRNLGRWQLIELLKLMATDGLEISAIDNFRYRQCSGCRRSVNQVIYLYRHICRQWSFVYKHFYWSPSFSLVLLWILDTFHRTSNFWIEYVAHCGTQGWTDSTASIGISWWFYIRDCDCLVSGPHILLTFHFSSISDGLLPLFVVVVIYRELVYSSISSL